MALVSRTGPYNAAAEHFGIDGDHSLLPRLKFNFYVEFMLNEGIRLSDESMSKSFVFDRVSSVGLPDVDYGITTFNQYNRQRHVPTRMTIGTIPISFYDTKDNQFQTLMKAYSNHYFHGHNLDEKQFSGYNLIEPTFTGGSSPFGAKTIDKSKRFMFEEIKISNVDSQQGGRTITLYNCMIQTINHDTLNYADSQPVLYNVVFQPEHFNIDTLDKEIAEADVEKSQAINGNLAGLASNRQAIEQDPVIADIATAGGRAFKGAYDQSLETLRNIKGKTFVFPKNTTSTGLAEGQLPQE